MYASTNFRSKTAFREAVRSGEKISLFAPGLGTPAIDGVEAVEGPWYPEPHRWYAEVIMKDGFVVSVK